MIPNEIKTLLSSNYYYSILYYNSEICLSPNLPNESKQQLMYASANALCSCMPLQNPFISFEAVHKCFHQSTPMLTGQYKMAIQLHKTFYSINHLTDWLSFANQIVSTKRQCKFDILCTNRYWLGLNIMANKLYHLKLRIDLGISTKLVSYLLWEKNEKWV